MADYPSQFIYDPRPIDPPEYFEQDDCIERLLIVDDSYGDNVPQVFCKRYFKPESVDKESWEICLSGPNHEEYWEAWSEVLLSWKIKNDDFTFTIEVENNNVYQCKQRTTSY